MQNNQNIFKDMKSLFKLREYFFLKSGEKEVSFYIITLMSVVHRNHCTYVQLNKQ